MLIKLPVGIVVSGRLLVCHTERTEQSLMLVHLPRKPDLGIEETKLLVDVQALQSVIGNGVPLVVGPFDAIGDVPVLHIGIHIQSVGQLIIGFQVNISVVLGPLVPIVFLVGRKLTNVVLHPKHLSEMVSFVTVEPTAQCSTQPMALIAH